MSDWYHPNSNFPEGCERAAEQHPDEHDPYWDSFWQLKPTDKLDSDYD